jgi:hypothetical protein
MRGRKQIIEDYRLETQALNRRLAQWALFPKPLGD